MRALLVTGVTLGLAAIAAGQPANPPPTDPNLDSEGKPLPGTTIPCAPIAEKRQELGCYVVARQPLGALPQGIPLFWQLDAFPTRAAAEAAKGPLGTVTDAFGRTWLFTIAPADWHAAPGAEHVAAVGPLPFEKMAPAYTAFYVATTFRVGQSSFVHEHPGPEAWFIVSGEQCLETLDGALRGRAGEGMVVRGELPMVVRATGREIRRNFALVLHDSAKPVTTRIEQWVPRGLCLK
ncbi:MAG TPA: hypothetical protein VFU71_05435 [Burkholderiaceae bacterium]|nr:hypothetical protein [Burkholderiaceae bacterium]